MSSDFNPIDRQRWAELKRLFEAALELPREEWPSLVERSRERDADLARQLQRLLDGHMDSLNQVRTLNFGSLGPGVALGPYVLTGLLGEGGMGQVFRAKDERLGREVAIKVLLPEVAHDADRRARMEREARAMGMLNHPNIVTVFDIGDHHGTPFIVSELLEGETLRQQITAAERAGKQFAPRRIVEMIAAVADALGEAHRRGVVHRDIKPENIFVTSDGRIKVLDFGIAKLLDGEPAREGTAVGTFIGTLQYMAPEQLWGKPARSETDVHGCGVVLYELIAGSHPYAGDTQTAVIGAILSKQPPALVGVAPSLAALVARCLDKQPENRYANGAELAAELRALTDLDTPGDAARLAPTSLLEPAAVAEGAGRKSARRVVGVGTMLALLASVAIIGSLMWWQPSEDASPEPPPTAITRPDIVLPLPPKPQETSVPAPPTAPVRTRPEGASSPQRKPATPEQPRVDPAPAEPPSAPPSPAAMPTLTGIWTLSEQINEDVHAIECSGSGALQLTLNDGVLDGTLRMKRDCKDAKKSTTDTTELTAALSAGASTDAGVSFVTRVEDEGLVTTCRYSGQVVGSSRGTIIGEVSCEARAAGLSSILRLRGSWRASRTTP